MLKKLIVASAILAVTTGVAVANPAPYIGAGLGVNVNTSNQNTNVVGSYRGVPVDIFAGYGGVVSNAFYLAGELNGTVVSGTLNNSGLKSTYGYGASIIPGLMLSDHTMAFARAGVVRTRFTQTGGMQTGGVLGFGLQTSLTQNVDLRGEYDFTAYQAFNTTVVAPRSVTVYSSAPRSDAAKVSLVYKFD